MLATSCGHTSLQLWKLDGKWYLLRVYPVRKPTDVLKNDVGKRTFLSSWDLQVMFHGRTMMLEMLNCFLASVRRHSAQTCYKEPNSAPDFHWSAFWNMVIYTVKPKLLVDFPPFFMTLSLTQTASAGLTGKGRGREDWSWQCTALGDLSSYTMSVGKIKKTLFQPSPNGIYLIQNHRKS